jgi:hypothetical protein
MTRSHLLVSTIQKGMNSFSVIRVPAAADDDGKIGLFRTLWVIHSGDIYGLIGKLIVDAIGIIFIILCITGLIYFFVPYRLNRMKDESGKRQLKRFNRNTLRWHNSIGSWAILFLILTTLTGMFLRPPLLIPIASMRVGKIPFTELSDPNPWVDRFRDILWDPAENRWLLATSEGIYQADRFFSQPLIPFSTQPPVSVMGINVFEQVDSSRFLVGSFSGIFLWEPSAGKITDYFTKMLYTPSGRGAPFGELSVAGYISMPTGVADSSLISHEPLAMSHEEAQGAGHRAQGTKPRATSNEPREITEILFDYEGGAILLSGDKKIPEMPEEIIRKSPISLWNAALEIHTGRIFQPVFGDFYILVVPVVGLFTLEISIVGFLAWWVARRKRIPSGSRRTDKPSVVSVFP